MRNTSIKDIMVSRNLINKLGKEVIAQIEEELYSKEEVKCVDAVHINEGTESNIYTWYIQSHLDLNIQIGDTLIVEQVLGIGLAIVKAVSTVYTKTKEQHENEVHPYCGVVSNLGVRL